MFKLHFLPTFILIWGRRYYVFKLSVHLYVHVFMHAWMEALSDQLTVNFYFLMISNLSSYMKVFNLVNHVDCHCYLESGEICGT